MALVISEKNGSSMGQGYDLAAARQRSLAVLILEPPATTDWAAPMLLKRLEIAARLFVMR
jgi:hypothetical protein